MSATLQEYIVISSYNLLLGRVLTRAYYVSVSLTVAHVMMTLWRADGHHPDQMKWHEEH